MEGEGEGDAFTDTCTHGSSLVGIEVGGWGGEGDPGGLGGGDLCEERGRREEGAVSTCHTQGCAFICAGV